MSTKIHIASSTTLRSWPRVMLHRSTNRFWLVHHRADLKVYNCYLIDEGAIVQRQEINDLIDLPEGTTLTVTNH